MDWEYIVGQHQAVRELRAIARDPYADPVMLRGNYGHGKTTLAKLTAKSRGTYKYFPFPPSRRELVGHLGQGTSLVIDEIHLTRQPEMMYDLMSEGRLVVFCTTSTADLPRAFLSRCAVITLQPYSTDEIAIIVIKAMDRWGGVRLRWEKAYEVAKRSHRNPRIGIILAKRVYRLLRMDSKILTVDTMLAEFDAMGVDAEGLTNAHRAYIALLAGASRPMGLSTISQSIGIDKDTLLNEIEPALLQAGRINITSRGRVLR